jgi:type IV pilus assembly protein PilA
MKSDFRAKLLQHVLSKKDAEKGFTLIELLVVIIIIGILAAIALPSFLNQSNKAKQGEAKTYVSSANKGQQAYFTEKGVFVVNQTNYINLGLGTPTETTNYTYGITGVNATSTNVSDNFAIATGSARNVALRGYAGRVNLAKITATSETTSYSVTCEVKDPGTAVPANPTFGDPSNIGCAGTQDLVGK